MILFDGKLVVNEFQFTGRDEEAVAVVEEVACQAVVKGDVAGVVDLGEGGERE